MRGALDRQATIFNPLPATLLVVFCCGMKTATTAEMDSAEVARVFSDLAQPWRRETAAHSVLQKKVLHPACQRIIGLGPAVVPCILRELRRQPGHWFWALNAITGEDPAPAGSTFEEAAQAWLKWGEERGYP